MFGRVNSMYVNQQKMQFKIHTCLEYWMHKKPCHDQIFSGGLSFFMIDWEVLLDFAVMPVYRHVWLQNAVIFLLFADTGIW